MELQRKLSKKIDADLEEERRQMEIYRKEPKILILGPSDSGKSTLLKQFKILHCSGFSSEEKDQAKYQIYKNLLIAAIILLAIADENAPPQAGAAAVELHPDYLHPSSLLVESFVSMQLGSSKSSDGDSYFGESMNSLLESGLTKASTL